MRFSRKELVAMIDEETERSARLTEVEVQNIKEPLSLEELDMLDLLLTRADLYGSLPDGHDPEVLGSAIDAVNDIYNETKKQSDREQPSPNAPGAQEQDSLRDPHGAPMREQRNKRKR